MCFKLNCWIRSEPECFQLSSLWLSDTHSPLFFLKDSHALCNPTYNMIGDTSPVKHEQSFLTASAKGMQTQYWMTPTPTQIIWLLPGAPLSEHLPEEAQATWGYSNPTLSHAPAKSQHQLPDGEITYLQTVVRAAPGLCSNPNPHLRPGCPCLKPAKQATTSTHTFSKSEHKFLS